MKFEVRLVIKVDPDANFLEVADGNSCSDIVDLFYAILYDVDDLKVMNCEVEKE